MASLSTLIDVNFTLINRIFLLCVSLLFFSTVYLIRRLRHHEIPATVTTPIGLSLFGFVLLYCVTLLSGLPSYHALMEGLLTIVVLVCLAKFVIYVAVDVYLRIHTKREVPSFLRDIVMLVVYLLVGILSLRLVFKIDLSAIAVTTTVITAVVAFALQNTLTNALSGFSIQSDRLLATQNWITIKDKNLFGEIINVGFRYTTLRTTEMNLVMVPNSIIMQNVVVIHGNQEFVERPAILVDVMLGYDMPPQHAKSLLMQVLKDESEILKTPEPLVRLFALNDSGITYQLKFWIADPGRRVPVQDLIYTRVWYAVNRDGFSFPFPHRQIITTEMRPPYTFSPAQVAQNLKGFDLFAMLDDADIQLLADNVPVMVFGPGEVIVRQGDSGSSLFIVLKGELAVMVDGIPVGGISQDSFFGEMSLLTGTPRTATVRAVCEVWLAEVTKSLMEPLLRAHPVVMENLSSILVERERRTKESSMESSLQNGAMATRQDFYLKRLKQFFGL
jgi:small-conductance mechanosensitive channel/CRP-like cAMP-binding protein